MKGTRYTYAASLCTGVDYDADDCHEIEVEVSYTVAWGSPETGAGYLADPDKYDPGSPDEVEDVRLELIGGATPYAFATWADLQTTEAAILQEIAQNHTDAMLQEARDREAAWAE